MEDEPDGVELLGETGGFHGLEDGVEEAGAEEIISDELGSELLGSELFGAEEAELDEAGLEEGGCDEPDDGVTQLLEDELEGRGREEPEELGVGGTGFSFL